MAHDPVQRGDVSAADVLPIRLLKTSDAVPEAAGEAARLQRFRGELGEVLALPEGIYVGAGDGTNAMALGAAGSSLPEGRYRLDTDLPDEDRRQAVLAFALGTYRFSRYRESEPGPTLLVDDEDLARSVSREAATIGFGRDLVNTPAEDMGPDALEAEARTLAESFGAEIRVHKGKGFAAAYPLIDAVGRAASQEPRLIEICWSGGTRMKLSLVGKGVCFDSGGLNIKGGKSMALMKKDMGGAATALALGRRIMEEKLPVDLRVLVPAVENAISGNAFRPGDVFRSRQGQTVEISNTDAEGRLILADALSYAVERGPDRLFSLATLTGAARVALGPDLPPIYATDSPWQRKICEAGMLLEDPLWPMPFWERYESFLSSDIADVNHAASTPFAGSITAALFLKRFVGDGDFTHIDTFAWNPAALPGRPKGGEVLGVRALFRALADDLA